jgi:nucleoside-diphosphate-sugar epimerase
MVHVDDLVSAILLAAEKEEANGEIFIVTDGKHYSSRQIYNEMCVAIGNKIPNWSVPKNIFYIVAKFGDLVGKFIKVPFDSYRYSKLFGDDSYSSAKISEKLHFQPKMTLKDAMPEIVDTIRK